MEGEAVFADDITQRRNVYICVSVITEAPTPIPETKHRQCRQIGFDPVDKTQTTLLCD